MDTNIPPAKTSLLLAPCRCLGPHFGLKSSLFLIFFFFLIPEGPAAGLSPAVSLSTPQVRARSRRRSRAAASPAPPPPPPSGRFFWCLFFFFLIIIIFLKKLFLAPSSAPPPPTCRAARPPRWPGATTAAGGGKGDGTPQLPPHGFGGGGVAHPAAPHTERAGGCVCVCGDTLRDQPASLPLYLHFFN